MKEPAIPPSCTTLTPRLSATDGTALAGSTEAHADTARIQKAIDECQPGRAVVLNRDGSKDAFLAGPLELRRGVTLRINTGVILFGSRNPRDYDVSPGSCGVVDENGHGCRGLINGVRADNAAVMGDGVIDGRGGAKLLGERVSWWGLAQQAKVAGRNQNCPRLLVLVHCNNFVLYRVTLRNSPNFHVFYSQGDGFTAWGVNIYSPKTARNTDGIDPVNSTNITITRCNIHAGDDNVAIKAGGAGGPSAHITVAHNHFFTGHGMSIGSETEAGVNHVRVSDLTIDGADNGLRIKSNYSRGGLVEDVVFEDVCIRNTKNPIFMDSNYSFYGKERNKLPVFRNITLRNVHILDGGKITLDGYDATHHLQMNLDGVTASDSRALHISAAHADLMLGPGPVNFMPSGEDVRVTGRATESSQPSACEGKFTPFPQN